MFVLISPVMARLRQKESLCGNKVTFSPSFDSVISLLENCLNST